MSKMKENLACCQQCSAWTLACSRPLQHLKQETARQHRLEQSCSKAQKYSSVTCSGAAAIAVVQGGSRGAVRTPLGPRAAKHCCWVVTFHTLGSDPLLPRHSHGSSRCIACTTCKPECLQLCSGSTQAKAPEIGMVVEEAIAAVPSPISLISIVLPPRLLAPLYETAFQFMIRTITRITRKTITLTPPFCLCICAYRCTHNRGTSSCNRTIIGQNSASVACTNRRAVPAAGSGITFTPRGRGQDRQQLQPVCS